MSGDELPDLQAPIRLSSFYVQGLFNEFNHHIPVNIESRITAIIAPNGSGKTVCLRLINALFRRQWLYFASVDFLSIEYKFTNECLVTIRKHREPNGDEEPVPSSPALHLTISDKDSLEAWVPELADSKRGRGAASIERFIPFLTRTGPTRFRHDHTGQTFGIQEVLDTYSDHLPTGFIQSLFSQEPDRLTRIIEGIDCHLIETQRLLILPSPEEYSYRVSTGGRSSTPNLAISHKAQTLKSVIGRDLQAYAALSQSLDRSFPERAIDQLNAPPPGDLAASLQELDEKRRQLTDAGILDTEAGSALNLPRGKVDDTVARVLSVYVQDTKQKLESLSTLLARITLFQSLVNRRFRSKQIEVDKEVGFKIKYHNGIVPLEKLSSGEQHQLVLFFELLFELKPNALILIDEPELSLHVAWQKKFISDLQKIIELNKFDVILATHSPQLIGRWQNLIIELGDVDDE
jgi:ABC-type lipoprotein export system ATPase subunit